MSFGVYNLTSKEFIRFEVSEPAAAGLLLLIGNSVGMTPGLPKQEKANRWLVSRVSGSWQGDTLTHEAPDLEGFRDITADVATALLLAGDWLIRNIIEEEMRRSVIRGAIPVVKVHVKNADNILVMGYRAVL